MEVFFWIIGILITLFFIIPFSIAIISVGIIRLRNEIFLSSLSRGQKEYLIKNYDMDDMNKNLDDIKAECHCSNGIPKDWNEIEVKKEKRQYIRQRQKEKKKRRTNKRKD